MEFDEATTVFNDPLVLTFEGRVHSQDEYRFLTFGVSLAHARWLCVTGSVVVTFESCQLGA